MHRPGLRRLVDGTLAGTLLGRPGAAAPEDGATVHRRRLAVVGTAVVGAALLGLALRTRPGSTAFYPLTIALAGTWITGGLLSGPLHLGPRLRAGAVLRPAALGVAAFAAFALTAQAVRVLPPVSSAVASAIHRADVGPRWLIVVVALGNGIAEEVYFRGALFSALGTDRPVVLSTLAYTLVTVATANVALVGAAAVMGALWARERQTSGGILAPAVTHLTWSVLMIFLLPR